MGKRAKRMMIDELNLVPMVDFPVALRIRTLCCERYAFVPARKGKQGVERGERMCVQSILLLAVCVPFARTVQMRLNSNA